MENFIVSARKYRPDNFMTVVGQESITRTLKNAIKNNHLAHAYLFCGPRGVGKTTCARIFAKTINCSNISSDFEACNECESCKSFNDNRSYNIHELDAASNNSVEDIRNLIDQVRIPPQVGKYSLYIIDEVHMLSTNAFNAFLKTLEEPPSYAIFILATTEKHKIIPTILSRCQIFDFNRIKIEDISKHLEYVAKGEGVSAEPEALNIIAQKADGAMRDALSFFDQIVSFAGNSVTYADAIENLNVLDYDYYFKLTYAFLEGNISNSLLIFDEILNCGFDANVFITGLSGHFRDLLVCKDSITIQLLEVGPSIKKLYSEQSGMCSVDFLLKALEITSDCDINYKTSKNKRLHVELSLFKLCYIVLQKNQVVPQQTIVISSTDQSSIIPTVKAENTSESLSSKLAEAPKDIAKKELPNIKTSSSFSIKDAMKGSVAKTEKTQEVTPIAIQETDTPFTQEQMLEKWNSFAESIKEEKARLYNTMTSQNPELKEDFSIELILSNELQQQLIFEAMSSILKYLHEELKNTNIKINTIVTEDKIEKKIYTNDDKYNFLSEKNPNLNLLRDQLNLDFN